MWGIEFTDEFNEWWEEISPDKKALARVAAVVRLLEEHGPNLEFPHSSKVNGSRHGKMRELRIKASGRQLRVFYAFDPNRSAVLLIGGDKRGHDRFYQTYVPRADKIYDEYLDQILREGPIT